MLLDTDTDEVRWHTLDLLNLNNIFSYSNNLMSAIDFKTSYLLSECYCQYLDNCLISRYIGVGTSVDRVLY